MEKEYFCTSCKKLVKDIYASGAQGTKVGSSFAASFHPALVCRECDTPVMQLTKPDKRKKQKLL